MTTAWFVVAYCLLYATIAVLVGVYVYGWRYRKIYSGKMHHGECGCRRYEYSPATVRERVRLEDGSVVEKDVLSRSRLDSQWKQHSGGTAAWTFWIGIGWLFVAIGWLLFQAAIQVAIAVDWSSRPLVKGLRHVLQSPMLNTQEKIGKAKYLDPKTLEPVEVTYRSNSW